MAVSKTAIKNAILSSINANGSGNNLNSEQSIDKFADDLAQIIKDAITSGTVSILATEVTVKVQSTSPGTPVACTQNLTGSIQ